MQRTIRGRLPNGDLIDLEVVERNKELFAVLPDGTEKYVGYVVPDPDSDEGRKWRDFDRQFFPELADEPPKASPLVPVVRVKPIRQRRKLQVRSNLRPRRRSRPRGAGRPRARRRATSASRSRDGPDSESEPDGEHDHLIDRRGRR
jgi:hypothetical protein